LSSAFPGHRSPPPESRGSSSQETDPSQSFHPLLTIRPVGRTNSQNFSPLQRHPLGQPHVRRLSPRLGSALRRSQPHSGFQASQDFAALFHAATVRGVLPSEVSPRRNRAPLSRPRCSLAVIYQRAESRLTGLFAAGFRDSHARTQSPSSPVDRKLPFLPPEESRSGHPWPAQRNLSFRQLHPLRSLDPPASPFALTRVAPIQRSILS